MRPTTSFLVLFVALLSCKRGVDRAELKKKCEEKGGVMVQEGEKREDGSVAKDSDRYCACRDEQGRFVKAIDPLSYLGDSC